MDLVKYEMEVPKEMKEIVDLLDAIAEKVMMKAELADYASIFGQAATAVDGVTGVKEEMKSQYRDEAAGYLVHKLMGRLLPVKDEK